MSNTVEAARKMVESQKETGKLCQIGHQRRSNPRYLRMKTEIIGDPSGTAKNLTGKSLLGEITHAYAQWNREVKPPLGYPEKKPGAPGSTRHPRLRQHGAVPQLAVLQKIRRRRDLRPRRPPDRPVQLDVRHHAERRSPQSADAIISMARALMPDGRPSARPTRPTTTSSSPTNTTSMDAPSAACTRC